VKQNDHIFPLEVLEGGPYPNVEDFIVQLDKTAPLGNGPFVPADLSTADFGKTYQVRVTDPATGSKCWGTVKIASYVACSGLTTIHLDSAGQAILQANAVDALPVDVCVPANTLTVATVNELSLLPLTCADKGVQNIELGLYDQLGNTSFCQSTFPGQRFKAMFTPFPLVRCRRLGAVRSPSMLI
jgi:hypothetical protein